MRALDNDAREKVREKREDGQGRRTRHGRGLGGERESDGWRGGEKRRERVPERRGTFVLRSRREGLEFKSLLIAKQLSPDLLAAFLWPMFSSANNAGK